MRNISLEKILKITDAESKAKEIKASANEEAKKNISNTIKLGESQKVNEIKQADKDALLIVHSAEHTAEKNSEVIKADILQECKQLRDVVAQKKELSISYIIERVVKI